MALDKLTEVIAAIARNTSFSQHNSEDNDLVSEWLASLEKTEDKPEDEPEEKPEEKPVPKSTKTTGKKDGGW